MATTTFAATLTATAWTQVGSGTNTEVGIALVGAAPAALYIGASEPALDATAFMTLAGGDNPSSRIPLTSGDLVYARALNSTASVSGYTA